jgi:hypothetical protein
MALPPSRSMLHLLVYVMYYERITWRRDCHRERHCLTCSNTFTCQCRSTLVFKFVLASRQCLCQSQSILVLFPLVHSAFTWSSSSASCQYGQSPSSPGPSFFTSLEAVAFGTFHGTEKRSLLMLSQRHVDQLLNSRLRKTQPPLALL